MITNWKSLRTCLIVVSLFLSHFVGRAQVTASAESSFISFQVHELLLHPEKFLQLWGNIPIPISSYSAKEKAIQQRINHQIEGILSQENSDYLSYDSFPITPYTWKWIDFEYQNENGEVVFSLRRPNKWIIENGATEKGNSVYVDMPEMGIKGWARVVEVRVNQLDTRLWEGDTKQIKPITGTFRHFSDDVYDLFIEGLENPIGVTSKHPFWSEDKKGWTSVENLSVGEAIRTYSGDAAKITQLSKRPDLHEVFNIEVYQNHNYYVSQIGLLAHNVCWDNLWRDMLNEALRSRPRQVFNVYKGVVIKRIRNGEARFLIPALENTTRDALTGKIQEGNLGELVEYLKEVAKTAGAQKITIRGSQIRNTDLAELLKKMSENGKTYHGLKVDYGTSQSGLGVADLSGDL